MEDIALTPGGADEDLPGRGIEGGKDVAGDDGDSLIHFFDGARVSFVVNVVGEQHACRVKTDYEGRAVTQADEGRIAAFGFGAELTPMGVIQIVTFDLETARHAPAELFIRHDVGKGDMPTYVVGDEISDLATGNPSRGRSSLQNEEAIVRIETDAECEESNGDGGSFGGAAKGLDHKPFALRTAFRRDR